MLYPVRNCTVFNLVLSCPDDLPPDVAKQAADVEQMRSLFENWDPLLRKVISQTKGVYKWKLSHMAELDAWVKDSVAMLGDSCHPSPPYQAQGAAMAVEDGACIGTLLGLVSRSHGVSIPEVLKLYEELRKRRNLLQVTGAMQNQELFHLGDEDGVRRRNDLLQTLTWDDEQKGFPWLWGDMNYQTELNGFDTVQDAKEQFAARFGSKAR